MYKGDNLLELLLNRWCPSEVVEPMALLLQGGANINKPSKDGHTPLQTACCRGFGQAGLQLLKQGD